MLMGNGGRPSRAAIGLRCAAPRAALGTRVEAPAGKRRIPLRKASPFLLIKLQIKLNEMKLKPPHHKEI